MLIIIIIRQRQQQSEVFKAQINRFDQYSDFDSMSDTQLGDYIDAARDDYLTWAGANTVTSIAPGTLASGDLSRVPPLNVPQLVKDIFISFAASPDTVYHILRKIIRFTVKTAQCRYEKSLQHISAVDEAKPIFKNGVKVGERMTGRLAFKAPAKALTAASSRIASRLAVMGALAAAGPPGWAVEAAMFAFQATLGMMDQFGVGGYEELVTERMYAGMRDYFDREFEKYCRDEGYGWPVPYGPLNKLSEEETEKELGVEMAKIMENEEHPITKLITALLTNLAISLNRVPTDQEIENALKNDSSGVLSKLSEVSYENLAARYNSKMVKVGDDLRNSYLTREATESSFNWPLVDEKKDYYVEWDDATQTSYLRCSKMREYAESLGFGCTYDKVRRLPKVTESYCLENGLYFDGQGKECRYKSSGQKIAELIFGKAFVRGLLQVFDPDMYKNCSDMGWCNDGQCRDDGAYFCVKSTLSYSRPPRELVCPDGYDETAPGWCNRECPDGFFRRPGDQICYDKRIAKDLVYTPEYSCSEKPYTYVISRPIIAGTRCYDTWCKTQAGVLNTRCSNQEDPGDKWKYSTASCKGGYVKEGITCRAISRPLETAKPKSGVAGIGVCPSGTRKSGDLCYAPCRDGYDDWPAGVCNSRSNNPKLEIKPKERKAPYGKTDFKNSPIGQRIQSIKDNIREGDIGGVAAGIGALYLQGSPIVNGLGLQDLANMIPDY